MAVINVTPDSFSDGGRHAEPEAAADAAERAVAEGADAIDVGGESTRPGAERVAEGEQIRRVVPAIAAMRRRGVGALVSVDTTLAAVARAAIDAGADAINDVSGGTEDPAMLGLAASSGAGLVLMHRRAAPPAERYSDRMPAAPAYGGGVVEAVRVSLAGLVRAAVAAGCEPASLVADPGLGFGKSVGQNAELVRRFAALAPAVGGRPVPLLAGASRKSFVGTLSAGPGEPPPPPDGRLAGSIAFALAMLAGGARLFRVHDVREHAQALRVAWAFSRPGGPG